MRATDAAALQEAQPTRHPYALRIRNEWDILSNL